MSQPVNIFDAYVEKVVLKNQLVPEKRIVQAKAYLISKPDFTLLDVLMKAKWLSPQHFRLISRKFEDYSHTHGLNRDTGGNGKNPSQKAPPPVQAEVNHDPFPAEVFGSMSSGDLGDGPDTDDFFGGNGGAPLLENLDQYLGLIRDMNASDLHITVNAPPMIRKNARLCPVGTSPLNAEQTERLLFTVLDVKEKQELIQNKKLDTCLCIGGSRYRSCFVKQQNGWDGTFRLISGGIPEFFQLGLPEDLKKLTDYNEGLVLIAGPGRSGISTTLAAFIDMINHSRNEHIITLEKPVEYVYQPDKAHISQREIGVHTGSYSMALRAALREDPDVIVVGELHDRETTSLAVTAAETGHLVFATMHTTSSAQTVERLLHFFPPDQRGQIRSMISESLRGIICQRLLPRSDGRGLTLALEVMKNNASIANLIREDRLVQLANAIQINNLHGMRLLDDSIMQLIKSGAVNGEEAYFAASDRERFEQWAPGLNTV